MVKSTRWILFEGCKVGIVSLTFSRQIHHAWLGASGNYLETTAIMAHFCNRVYLSVLREEPVWPVQEGSHNHHKYYRTKVITRPSLRNQFNLWVGLRREAAKYYRNFCINSAASKSQRGDLMVVVLSRVERGPRTQLRRVRCFREQSSLRIVRSVSFKYVILSDYGSTCIDKAERFTSETTPTNTCWRCVTGHYRSKKDYQEHFAKQIGFSTSVTRVWPRKTKT